MDQQTNPNPTAWKAPGVPLTVVQVIPHDGRGNLLFMHRSNNVRSARNVWSFPSGQHDIGETLEACSARELLEEYNLRQTGFQVLGIYENIAGDADAVEQYHWVIIIAAAQVENLAEAVNNEPEKHDQFAIIPAIKMISDGFFVRHPLHSTLMAWMATNIREVMDALIPTAFEESVAAQAIANCGNARKEEQA